MKSKHMKMKRYMKVTAKLAIVAVLAVSMNMGISRAQAASVTKLSDVMSRLKASTASNHEIQFNSPTGIAGTQTVTLTFSSGFTGVSSIVFGDVDFATSNNPCQSSPTFTEQTLNTAPSGATWGVGASGQVITITSGSGTATAGNCIRIRIGTNAVTGTTGTHQISNGAIGSNDTVTIGGTFGDTGVLSVEVLTNDQITISATVDPTITFTLIDGASADNAVGFGTLTTANARYATADSLGSTTDPAAGAAVATVATNASSGYVLSYFGDTLKSGTDSISAATISGSATGTPNSSQFSSSYETNGSSTITAGYEKASNNWNYVTNTTTTVVSRTTPTNTETIKMHYLANIAGTTPAGSYSTTITYIATGTF